MATIRTSLFFFILLLVILSCLAGLFEEEYWLLSLVSQFKLWFWTLSLLTFFLSFFLEKMKALFIPISFILVFYTSQEVYPYLGSGELRQSEGVSISGSRLSLFYANLNSQNKNKHLLIEYLRESRPEIVFLVEVSGAWAKTIQDLESIYPYSKAIVLESNFGLAVLSQRPLKVKNVFVDRENMIPALFLSLESSIGDLSALLIHAFPPISKYGTMLRDQYLSTLARRVREDPGPLIICGDFNTAPWTKIFKKFMIISGSQFERPSKTTATWPKSLGPFGLPIDHCLQKGVRTLSYKKGPDIGSDHSPLEVIFVKESRDLASD